MSPERLERVKEVLDEALELASAERSSFLRKICDGDQILRREVESLLAQEDTERPWREGPLVSLLDTGAGLRPEQRIGPYRIVRVIGEGGMGTVGLAVREDDFEKRVALKVIPPYRMSSEFVRRFHNERQLLAQLEHPNIARILDGGTTDDGQPYFVMEYVEGEPIDVWCERRALSIRARLELFLQVTSAIQLAHRNLVVHRDLKPSNILVTDAGVPKLLDFGIAKQLAPEADGQLTRLTQRPMTVRYASPEQIGGRPITTASDTYSLGLLLYQLLTSRYPFASEGDSDLDVAQAIRDDEPRKPSAAQGSSRSLRRCLAGDLDSMILKAMRKEPGRRYASVEQMAEDIRRYLSGRPVIARRGIWSYRASKFVRRYKLPLAAVAILVLLSLAFGIISTILWQQAVFAKEDALREQQRSENVLDIMKGLFRASDPNQNQGEELTAREILDRGEQEVETLDDPSLQAELLATIGEIYAQLGKFNQAGGAWKRAEELLRQLYPQGHPELAKAINNLAGWFYHAGDFEQAERLYLEALEMKLDLGVDTAKSLSTLAGNLMSRGEFAKAEVLYQKALELRKTRYGHAHLSVARTLRSLGVLYYTSGDHHRAEGLLREALATFRNRREPDDALLAATLSSLGRVLHALGRFEEAELFYNQALEIRHQLFVEASEDHPHIAASQLDLARLYLDIGRLERGQELLAQAIAILNKSKNLDAWEIAQAESVLGAYLTGQGDYQLAETYLTKSYRRLAEVRGERSIYARNALDRLQLLQDVRSRQQ